MSWTKFYEARMTDPRIKMIQRAIGNVTEPHVWGALVALWLVGRKHGKTQRDGSVLLPGWTAELLDEQARTPGLTAALSDPRVDWARVQERGIVLPRFSEKNATVEDDNKRSAQRMAKSRARCRDVARNTSATVVQRDVPVAAVFAAREEKRREEQKREDQTIPPNPPAGGGERASEPPAPELAIRPPEPQPEPQGEPMGFNRRAAAEAIAKAYPAAKAASTPFHADRAIIALGPAGIESRFTSESAAAEWLLGRVRAYAASPAAKAAGEFQPSLKRWLDERQYDTPDELWNRRPEPSAASAAPAPVKVAQGAWRVA